MNDYASNLIKDTFENCFDKDRYIKFLKNLLNTFDDSKAFSRPLSGNYIKKPFQDSVSSYLRVGQYIDPDGKIIDLLIVNLRKKRTLDYARTLQRNFIADYLDGGRGEISRDAALVAFISDESVDWRFSLVKMDYKINEGKVVNELTPAKRYSYLVGQNEKSHTAKSRLVPIIQDDIHSPSLKQLEEAFSIEKVTKEFFEKYRDLFYRLNESLSDTLEKDQKIKLDFKSKNIETVGFAKKLLGQVVFLYFLQKKGWFGVEMNAEIGTGPKNFLRILFKKEIVGYSNFFNDVLEPLFYKALSVERKDNRFGKLKCKIPFLNGGLFDPIGNYDWEHTDILIDNELFSNDHLTIEGDLGTGILDVFDRYNFTVQEDEPLEKEVAVDPEMLGKVFENLLEVKDRKSKGTYYTPREIVHYMCQESLINYLNSKLDGRVKKSELESFVKYGERAIENDLIVEKSVSNPENRNYEISQSIRQNYQFIDDLLIKIKVCDPAIGSGAFPVGMMSEIVKCRNILSSYFENKDGRSIYDLKRHAIQESVHGVDIDPGAVEIAKLRLWLSLIVDEDDVSNIKPLPNLDYKIMQGNSLLEEYEGVKLIDERLFGKNSSEKDEIDGLIEKQYILQKEHKFSNNENRRKTILIEIAELGEAIYKLEKGRKNNSNEMKVSLFPEINERIEKLHALFDKQKQFFNATQKSTKDKLKSEVEKLIWEHIEATLNDEGKAGKMNKLRILKNENINPFFLWKLNFYDVFKENGGFDIVIANPPYIRADDPSIKDQRTAIINSKSYETLWEKWDLYVAFIEKGYRLLKQDGVLEFIIPDAYIASKYAIKSHDYFLQNATISRIDFLSGIKVFEAAVKNIIIEYKKAIDLKSVPIKIKHSPLFENSILLPSKLQNQIGDFVFKIDNENIEIGKLSNTINWGKIFYVSKGMVLNADENDFQGEFKKEDLISTKKDKIHSKKYIEAKWIKKYIVKRINFLEWDTDRVPKKISRPTFSELYIPEKIMLGGMTGAIVDNSGLLCNHSISVSVLWKDLKDVENRSITGSIKKDFKVKGDIGEFRKKLEDNSKNISLKYLLAILNSKIAGYYLNQVRRSQIGFYPDDLKKLPIKIISVSSQKPFIEIVDKITEITRCEYDPSNSQKKFKISEYEKQLDQMVYKLYGLTKEEIGIVETTSD